MDDPRAARKTLNKDKVSAVMKRKEATDTAKLEYNHKLAPIMEKYKHALEAAQLEYEDNLAVAEAKYENTIDTWISK